MARTMEVSPYITKSLRKLGKVYELSEEERTLIREGDGLRVEGFSGFFTDMRNAGAPEDRRYHMRTYFNLLREAIKRKGDIVQAIEDLEFYDSPAEASYWERCGRTESSNVVQLRADWQRGRGCR